MTLFSPLQFSIFGQAAGFEHPLGLVLSVAVVAVTVLAAGRALRRRGTTRAWVTPGHEDRLVGARWTQRRALRLGLGGAGLALLAVAWAGPLFGEARQKVTRRGIDLVVALDASRSMLASDVAPSRLTAARAAVEQLLERLAGDRVGVVAFARDAFVQSPLTTDYDAARLYLRAVDPLQMQQGGTALAGALQQAGGMFDRAAEAGRDRAVLLVTDGEDWEGGAVEEAKRLASGGVRVFTLGVGTQQGAPVPVVDARGRVAGYEKDGQGAPVVTRPNPGALAAIAAAGNGEAFFEPGRVDVGPVWQRLDALQKGELGSGVRVAALVRYQWFALPGVLLLAFALGLSETKSRGQPKASRRGAVAASAAVVAALLAPSARAAGWLESPEPNVREGLTAYQKGDFAAAAAAFGKAKRNDGAEAPVASFDRGVALYKAGQKEESLAAFADARAPELQGRDSYNAGVALAALSKKEEAIHAFRSALEVDPQNEDARHNLEVLLAKDEQRPQQEQQEQQQQEQQQQEPKQGQGPKQPRDAKPSSQNRPSEDRSQQHEKQQDQGTPGAPRQETGEAPRREPPVVARRAGQPRSDAERALDQLKQGERLLPLGRPTAPPHEDESHEHTW